MIWTAPDPEDRDSMWLIEVYNDEGTHVAIEVGDNPEDLMLAVVEKMIPSED